MKKILLTILAVLAMAGMAMAQTAPSDINLHRNDDGTWSFTMPARNLVMNTETFSGNDPNGYTLAGVPEGWLVIAAGDTVTITDGVTTPITATANDGSGVTASCAVTVTIPPISTYLTDGASVRVSFVDEYGETTTVRGDYYNGLITSVEYNRDGGTLTKNGNIIHAWVKSSHESEATIDINITNNTYTVSYVNGSVMFTGLSSVFIGGTNVKNLLTLAAN